MLSKFIFIHSVDKKEQNLASLQVISELFQNEEIVKHIESSTARQLMSALDSCLSKDNPEDGQTTVLAMNAI